VRGEGGRLKNSQGRRFMEDYDSERMELSARDIVARAIYKEVQAGRGTEHGGAYLDITHRGADYIKKKLPSMHEQFLKLADVDITKGPMEVGPTIHYVMGGIKVDPESAAASVPGLFAAGEVAGGLHGANRLGGNSLSDILVFGRRAGEGAAAFAQGRGEIGAIDESLIEREEKLLLQPFANYEAGKRENPFTFMADLQEVMGEYNGLARTGEGLEEGLKQMLGLKERVNDLAVADSRMFNPGWHSARDQRFMVEVCEAMIRCGIERAERPWRALAPRPPRPRPRMGQAQPHHHAGRRRGQDREAPCPGDAGGAGGVDRRQTGGLAGRAAGNQGMTNHQGRQRSP